MAGTPTPTQAELNKIALGEPVELADDGSGPDPNVLSVGAKQEAPKQPTTPRSPARSPSA